MSGQAIDLSLLECIDAISGLNALPQESIDVLVTSPPFNIGKRYDSDDTNDSLPRNEYLRFIGHFAKASARALKPNGSVFFNFSGRPTDRWLPHEVVLHFRDHYELQNEFHWVKSIAIDDVTYGQYQPINSTRFVNCQQEYVWHFTKTGQVSLNRTAIGVPFKDKTNLKRWKAAHQNGKHCRGNVWFVPYETRNGKPLHPAMFPTQLVSNCLGIHGLPPRPLREQVVVCDPFAGSGTVGLVAAHKGCRFVGFDLSMNYLMLAAGRIFEATGVKSLLKISMQPAEKE